MTKNIDAVKLKIEQEKEKIRLKEKLFKEKEKQKRSKRFSEIGRIASKVDIDLLDDDVLLGAFIEISEKIKDNQISNQWKEKASTFLKTQDETIGTPLSISFSIDPNKDVKNKLKDLGFRWNSFRKEFFGHGDKISIEKIVEGTQYKIEILG